MIYKVLYQPNYDDNPTREGTKSLYLEANSLIEVRELLQQNTNYNVELIEELSGPFLEFEQNEPNYKLTEF